jgi:hypothetical protein
LRAGAVLAAIALVSASCGSRVRQEEWDALGSQQGNTTSATTPEGDVAPSTDTDTATTVATRKSSDGSSKGGAAVSGQTGPLPAPADGTYTYDESGGGAKRATTEQWTAQRQPDSVALTSVRKQTEDGDTITLTSKYRVTRTALEMLSQTSAYDDEEPDTCSFKPPATVMPLPLKVGAKWKSAGTCEGDEPSDEDSTSFEITGTSNDTVGGTAVKTFLVKGTQSFDTTDETTGERTTYSFTDTRHVDPATLLVVSEDLTFNFDGHTNTVHRQLRSLTPA